MRLFDTLRRRFTRCDAPVRGAPPAPLVPLADPTTFFLRLKHTTGRLAQVQVDSINAILWHGRHFPVAWMAYALATAFHESRFMPIAEKGGRAYLSKYDTGRLAKALGNTPEADGDGIKYAGRGFVQLTGTANYRKAGEALGLDLLKDPDLALDTDIAARILIWGMEGGHFTGKKLGHYLLDKAPHKAFVNARRIVNGTDRADTIAGYATAFQQALIDGGWRG